MNWIGFQYRTNNMVFAKENRKNPTKGESLVRNMILKNKKLGVKFLRQRMIGNYITDFYCSKLKLIIEIDGESHNYKFDYDQKRKKYLESLGLKVLIYTNEQVLNNLQGVSEDISYIVYKLTNKKIVPL